MRQKWVHKSKEENKASTGRNAKRSSCGKREREAASLSAQDATQQNPACGYHVCPLLSYMIPGADVASSFMSYPCTPDSNFH